MEAVKRGIDADNRGDVETHLGGARPRGGYALGAPRHVRGESTVFRGHDDREIFRDLNEAFAEIQIEISEIRDLGDRLVATGRNRARGKGAGPSGVALRVCGQFKNGKAVWIGVTSTPRKPSKPQGCRNRRCRRRTWRTCVAPLRYGTRAIWTRSASSSMPTSSSGLRRVGRDPGPYVGREAVMRQFEQNRETWDSDSFELTSDFIDVGDRVAVRFIWEGAGHGPESNIEADGP